MLILLDSSLRFGLVPGSKKYWQNLHMVCKILGGGNELLMPTYQLNTGNLPVWVCVLLLTQCLQIQIKWSSLIPIKYNKKNKGLNNRIRRDLVDKYSYMDLKLGYQKG